MHRFYPTLFLVLFTLAAVGCGSGFLAHAVAGPGKVKAVYEIQDRPTLIVVDDPAERFDDPNLPSVVAVNLEHHLRQNKAITAQIIPAMQLANLEATLGEDYAKTPIDELGRTLGAEQVIYVVIDDIAIENVPGVYRPVAVARVKVIDAVAGKRLFPVPSSLAASEAPSRGLSITTEMSYRGAANQSQVTPTLLKKALAEVLGRDAARLFYDWKKPEIGSRFDEP